MKHVFEKVAGTGTRWAGSPWGFGLALAIILVWAVTGPIFGFSEVWQLVINTGTTIITFLMVFLIQHSQNKDSKAVQMKLNEMIAATEGASNRLIDIESLDERELRALHKRFEKLAELVKTHSRGGKETVEETDEIPETDRFLREHARKRGRHS